jgi:hypothetical protein
MQGYRRQDCTQDTREDRCKRGREEATVRGKRGCREGWRRERRKILRVYPPTRGRWSTEPPPRTGLPSVRRFRCVCQTCARLVSPRPVLPPVDQPVRPCRADGSFASLNPSSGPSSRLSSRPISRPSEFTWFVGTIVLPCLSATSVSADDASRIGWGTTRYQFTFPVFDTR